MSESMTIEIRSERETKKLAALIAHSLQGGESIGLRWELGAGKTTFTRYLVQALGISDAVSSPTFVVGHEYKGSAITVEHWDLYRLGELPPELREPQPPAVVRLIEWPERAPELASQLALSIEITVPQSAQGDEEKLTEQRRFCLTGALVGKLQIAFKHGTCS